MAHATPDLIAFGIGEYWGRSRTPSASRQWRSTTGSPASAIG